MINDSMLTNNSCTQALKQHLFCFQAKVLNKKRKKQLLKDRKQILSNNQNPQNQQKIYRSWKPRISSKKIMENPKFAFTLQKRKKRQLLGIKQIKGTQGCKKSHDSRSASKSRIDSPTKTKLISFYRQMLVKQNTSLQTLPIHKQPKQKKQKTPHLNFNLHHIINKRKALSQRQQVKPVIQGSNLPFYNFFASEKFLASNPTVQCESTRKRAYESSSSYRDKRRITANSIIKRPSTTNENYERLMYRKSMYQTFTVSRKQI